MKKADERLIQALVGLKRDPNWEPVREWLSESLIEQHETNAVMKDEVDLRQGQGKAQVLQEILKEAEDALKVHHKMAIGDTSRVMRE